MASLKELRNIRIEKMQKLKQLGIDPYPAKSNKEFDNINLHSKYENYESKEVNVSGRITSIRTHGKLAFIDLKDHTGKIQLYIKQDNLQTANHNQSELTFSEIDLLDLGDFAEGKGIVTKTQRGEISVEVTALRILTKSLRPMPDAWDGLKDKETRLRRRYLDTNLNEDVFKRFERRAKYWEAHREFFKQNGFLEMNIPVLEAVTGGADAKPFVTHMDAIDTDFYLRISQELYLKRLIGGGYHKVFEIGPRFRNEGYSDEHLPEHMAMEFYWAYADYRDGMEFTKEMFRYVADKVWGTQKFNIKGFDVDLSKEWNEIDYTQIFKERFNIDIFNTTLDEIKEAMKKNKLPIDKKLNINRGIDQLWKVIRATIAGPAFMVNEPKFLSPLAKSSPEQPALTQRFHPMIAGSELGNAFSELNDPIDQLDRFLEQQNMRDSGDDEAQMLDIDFVEMLEYGMPPTFGYGHSERNFWYFEDVTAREGVPFPQLRHEIDSVTKSIYPEIFKKDKNIGKGIISMDPATKEKYPTLSVGYAIIKGVNIEQTSDQLENIKNQVLESLKGVSTEDINKFPELLSYRKLYKAMGVDWHSRRPSPEALLRRIAQGKELYNVNTCVDAYNLSVLKNRISIGAFDLQKLKLPTIIKEAEGNEKILLLGDDKLTSIQKGELCYFDENGAYNLDFNYRDSQHSKVTTETKDILINVDGIYDITEEEVERVLNETIISIIEICGGKLIESGIIN